jgi:hypothetical protein
MRNWAMECVRFIAAFPLRRIRLSLFANYRTQRRPIAREGAQRRTTSKQAKTPHIDEGAQLATNRL